MVCPLEKDGTQTGSMGINNESASDNRHQSSTFLCDWISQHAPAGIFSSNGFLWVSRTSGPHSHTSKKAPESFHTFLKVNGQNICWLLQRHWWSGVCVCVCGGGTQVTFDNLTVFIQLEWVEETRNGEDKGRLAWDRVCYFKHFTLLSSFFKVSSTLLAPVCIAGSCVHSCQTPCLRASAWLTHREFCQERNRELVEVRCSHSSSLSLSVHLFTRANELQPPSSHWTLDYHVSISFGCMCVCLL